MRRDEQKRGKKPARRLRDAKNEHLLRGTVEAAGNQENMKYVVLNPGPGDSYLVQPIVEWWHFRIHKDYATLNIDEAEEKMKSHESSKEASQTMRSNKRDFDDEGGLVKLDHDTTANSGDEGGPGGEGLDFDDPRSDDSGDDGKDEDLEISGDEKVANQAGTAEEEEGDEDLKVEGTEDALNDHGKELKDLLDMVPDDEKKYGLRKKTEEEAQGSDDDVMLSSSSDENFFGEEGNTIVKDAATKEKEKEIEKMTGVSCAPETKKKKKKKRKEMEDGSPGTSSKKLKTEKSPDGEASEEGLITLEELTQFVTASEVGVKELVAHFKRRLSKSKSCKQMMHKLIKEHFEVGDNKVLRRKLPK